MLDMLLGGIVRLLQSLASCAPTLFVGLLVAGVLRHYFGSATTKKLFGGESFRSLPQSWLIGMLLPVCSIGVIPILFQLRRAGVRPGAMTAFALSAPLFNPLSLLYGLTLSRPLVILSFAGVSLLVVTILGMVWDRFTAAEADKAGGAETDGGSNPQQVIGIQRLSAMSTMMARDLFGVTGVLALVACAGPMILGMLLPHGALQSSVEQMDPLSPLRMMLVAVPVYATPMLTMSQLGMMFQHANSPGAALVLLLLGTGMNLATLVWLLKNYGRRSTGVWLAALLIVVMACAYGVDRPLIPPGVQPAGHTHAFDVYTNPFPSSSVLTGAAIFDVVKKSIGFAEASGLVLIGCLLLFGVVVRACGWGLERSSLIERPAEVEQISSPGNGGFDIVVPPVVLGFVMLVGLVAFSIVGCFAYYPHPDETLKEIQIARVEALTGATSGEIEHSLHWIGVWDDWSRRLEVSVFLRTGQVRPYQRMQGYLLRKRLELLEHELEHDPFEPDEVRLVVSDLMTSHQRFARAFQSAAKSPVMK